MDRFIGALVGTFLGGGLTLGPAMYSWSIFFDLPWNILIIEGPFDRLDRCSTITLTMFGMGVSAGAVLGWRAAGKASGVIRDDLPEK